MTASISSSESLPYILIDKKGIIQNHHPSLEEEYERFRRELSSLLVQAGSEVSLGQAVSDMCRFALERLRGKPGHHCLALTVEETGSKFIFVLVGNLVTALPDFLRKLRDGLLEPSAEGGV